MRIYNNSIQSLKNAIAALESQVSSYKTSFSQADVDIEGIYIATHNLGTLAVSISVFDETGEQIFPGEIVIVDANAIAIDLSAYTPINGSYKVLIYG